MGKKDKINDDNILIEIIVGITVKDTDTKSEIKKLPIELYHIIPIPNKAFQKIK